MLDAVHLEERGIPTVTFVASPFLEAARTHARLQGLPSLAFVVVPADYLDAAPGVDAAMMDAVLDGWTRGRV